MDMIITPSVSLWAGLKSGHYAQENVFIVKFENFKNSNLFNNINPAVSVLEYTFLSVTK